MKILKQGAVYRNIVGPFRYQAWPSLCGDENGVLYAVWSGHRSSHVCPFGKNMMSKSYDGGETWSAPQIINDTWLDDRDAGITYLGDGKMLLTYFCHPKDIYYGIWRNWIVRDAQEQYRAMVDGAVEAYKDFTPDMNRAGSFVKLSHDYGNTWEESVRVPVTAPHGPVKTRSGRLLYLGKEFPGYEGRYRNGPDFLEDENDPTPAEDRGRIFLYESFDDGRTWKKLSKLDIPDGGIVAQNLHEPHIIELPSGELVAAIRGNDGEVYHKFSMFFANSTDGGKTFSQPRSCEISGSPPHLMQLPDGRILISFARREAPCGIRAVISSDGCRSFGEEMVLDEDYNGDIGYPATVALADGSLVTIYYKHYENDRPTSILYTKWTLE